jgi:hypothetical protein
VRRAFSEDTGIELADRGRKDLTTRVPETGESTTAAATAAEEQSKLLMGAGTLVVCVAGILTVASAIECHAAPGAANQASPLTPSLLYGVVLWMWWAGVAHLFWGASRKWPFLLDASARNLVLQLVAGSAITLLHLTALYFTVRAMAQVWAGMDKAGYTQPAFFCLPRFGLDLLIYGCCGRRAG